VKFQCSERKAGKRGKTSERRNSSLQEKESSRQRNAENEKETPEQRGRKERESPKRGPTVRKQAYERDVNVAAEI